MISTPYLRSHLEARLPHMLERLRELVEVESPSDDKAGVDRASALVERWSLELGAAVSRHRQREFGDVLEVRFGAADPWLPAPWQPDSRQPDSQPSDSQPSDSQQPDSQQPDSQQPDSQQPDSGQPRVLVLGHLDTVWPVGTLAAMPWREAEGKVFGPGVVDMKAGVAMALEAFAALSQLGAMRPATLLLVSDEEIGSPVSRAITEHLARKSVATFVLEPAQGLAYKTARKGVGHFELHVTGVGAHAGVDFESGHSAVLAMAQLVEQVSGFTDLAHGITVNPGVIHGGTKSNVIASECMCEVDVRIAKASQAKALEAKFAKLCCRDQACTLRVSGGFNRPPMERSAGTVKLLRQAQAFAKELGFTLEEATSGGGSDGNFTAAVGCPTLDGMGAVGAGAHAAHEHVVVAHLADRTALLAAMIAGVA